VLAMSQTLTVVRPHAAEEARALTPREQEVLGQLAIGLNNAEIADLLFVSTATVKNHVANILAKLELRNRVQAAVYAWEHGLVDPYVVPAS
jgi:DNA-binding NarL/FixJ family response regulator